MNCFLRVITISLTGTGLSPEVDIDKAEVKHYGTVGIPGMFENVALLKPLLLHDIWINGREGYLVKLRPFCS